MAQSAAWLRTSPAQFPSIACGNEGCEKMRKDSAGPALDPPSASGCQLAGASCAARPFFAGVA